MRPRRHTSRPAAPRRHIKHRATSWAARPRMATTTRLIPGRHGRTTVSIRWSTFCTARTATKSGALAAWPRRLSPTTAPAVYSRCRRPASKAMVTGMFLRRRPSCVIRTLAYVWTRQVPSFGLFRQPKPAEQHACQSHTTGSLRTRRAWRQCKPRLTCCAHTGVREAVFNAPYALRP